MKFQDDILRIPEIGEAIYTFQEPMFEAEIIDRPNRFVVNVISGNQKHTCHLHDPGRLEELMYHGNTVLCRPTRGEKTSCSVTAAMHNREWVLTDTRVHSRIASAFTIRENMIFQTKRFYLSLVSTSPNTLAI